MIQDYPDLLVAVSEYTGRDDIAHLFPRFVKMAEAKMRRELRVPEMEYEATFTTEGLGRVTLPSNFIEMISFTNSDSGYVLKATSKGGAAMTYGTSAGTAKTYSVNGTTLTVHPTEEADFTGVYYAFPETITTAAAGVNAILTAAPSLYLYSVCAEVFSWAAANGKDAEAAAKATSANGMYMAEILALNARATHYKYANSRVTLSGVIV